MGLRENVWAPEMGSVGFRRWLVRTQWVVDAGVSV